MNQQYRSPWLTDELEDLQALTRAFLLKEAVPLMPRWAEQHFVDREFWAKAGEVGLLCPTVPEEYGGNGGNFLHQIAIVEEQSRLLDKGWGNAVHSGVVTDYIVRHGTEEQKERWLPHMVAGTTIAAIALTEPSAGSDLRSMKARARRADGGYILSGSKTFITNGSTADLIVVAAKLEDAEDPRAVTLFVVEAADSAGFSRGTPFRKIGQHAADTADLFFDDVVVPAGNLLGAENMGFGVLMEELPQERLVLGVNAVAQAEKAVDITAAYALEREAFGRPLIEQQNTRFVLAECATKARIGRVFLDDCIVRHSQGALDNETAAMAKWWLSDMQCEVVDRCLQIFGGYGYMEEYPIARMYADARVQKIYGGTNEVMKEIIARSYRSNRS